VYRINVSKTVLFGVAAVALGCSAFGEEAKARPNVLFLAVDDWNDWTGPMGNSQARTPHLDRLAKRGVTFSNAHCPAVYCIPSRTAVMTGIHPYTSGSYSDQTHMLNHPEYIGVQTWFSKNGYGVYGTGKLYHHMPGYVDLAGWDEFFVRDEQQKLDGWPMGSWDYGAPRPPDWPIAKIHGARENHDKPPTNLEYGAIPNELEGAMADTMRADWACKFLQRKHDQPFFLGVGFYAPHRPNYVPQKYFDLYPLGSVELPVCKEGDLDDLPASLRSKMLRRKEAKHDRLIELDEAKPTLRGYLAALSYADAMIGRVLDALDESGQADNTIVVLWSDNGYHHGEKTKWGKHTLWERTTNVPFMWAGPGVAPGAQIDTTVSLIDAYPTLLELCGLPPNEQVEGVSLASVLRKPESATDRSVVVSGVNGSDFAVINQSWRYIRYTDGAEELYDLKNDPNEWSNLAADKNAYMEVRRTMASHLPENPAKPGLGKTAKTAELVIDGEDFRWVAVDAGNRRKDGKRQSKRAASAKVNTGTDWRTVRHDKVLKPGQPFMIQVEYHGLKNGLVAGMSLNWHKSDGRFGGRLFVSDKINGVENDKVYAYTVELDELPEGIAWARLMTTVSPNGNFADRTHHTAGEEIPVGK
jgi:arylsulfatase A-like enzyme